MKTKFRSRLIICLPLILFIGVVSAQDNGNVMSEKRIVGGKPADSNDWLWTVNIVSAEDPSLYRGHICAGALIAPAWVATTAHCIQNIRSEFMDPDEIDVVLAAHNLMTDAGERISVKQIIPYPAYDEDNNWDCDFALLELDASSTYPPIPLIPSNTDIAGMNAVVVGWGNTSVIDIVYPEQLMEAVVPVVSNETCNQAYNKSDYYDDAITDCMLCAGYAAGGVDACQNDSGGPLMVQLNGHWVLAGLVSWGEGCALPEYYGVYSRIESFLDFAYSHIPPEIPIANDDTYSVVFGGTLSEPPPGVLLNDYTGLSDTMAVYLVSDVSLGILDLNSDGSFTYTHNGISGGVDTFTYFISDGGQSSNPAAVSIMARRYKSGKADLYAGSGCFIETVSFGVERFRTGRWLRSHLLSP